MEGNRECLWWIKEGWVAEENLGCLGRMRERCVGKGNRTCLC